MKKLCMCFALLMVLGGCGLAQETAYVSVEPHDEEYGTEMDSDVLTVGSYLSLRNAIQMLVEGYAVEGVIRAETYAGNLSEDLSKAVDEITNTSPLGAYTVSSITYDFSQIVSYYEIHINILYRRSPEEIASIVYVADTAEFREKLMDAMEEYRPSMVVQIGSYEPIDLETEVTAIYQEHPEFALELPEVSMEVYPESGSQRIVEIQMDYILSTEELTACREELNSKISSLQSICSHISSDVVAARRIYHRLGRNAVLKQTSREPLDQSAYGALINGCATSYGFAQAYRLIAEACGMPCQMVTGWENGAAHYWCLIELDGEYYYLDPSRMVLGQETDTFLMGDAELEEYGYRFGNEEDYPTVILPDDFKASAETGTEGQTAENEIGAEEAEEDMEF